MEEKKEIIYSGIQPSGGFTIGNYFGAMKNWVNLQNDYDSLFCIVDLHAITVAQKPADLRRQIYESYALLMAVGLNPDEAILYVQSQVPAHAELAWLLNCYTYMGELNRMTQFKDKSKKQGQNIRVGLYDYPVLMAADILLYQTNLVPVGEDQKQHVELTRDIAERFNQQYSPTFAIPEPYIRKVGGRVMSLQEPNRKMSKSDENENAFVKILDKPDVIIKKFKRAVTDSDNAIVYDVANKPGISNLIEIYACATDKSFEEIEKECVGMGYGDFKIRVAEAVIASLSPIQKEFDYLMENKKDLESIMAKNAEKANYLARKTLSKVKRKIGLIQV
jgi:tryptophanyl-tRNA synthetase